MADSLTRRDALKSAAAAAVLRGPLRAASRPHILLLMTDQHRGDCLGADGNRVIRTPHLDRIAREGVLFRHAYSATPTCTPARAALLTGLSPWHHGMLGYGRVAEKYPLEMPRALREAGYHGLGVGKMHWHPQRNLHGFHQTILDEQDMRNTPDFRSDYHGWFHSVAPHLDPNATGLDWNGYEARPYALPEHLHPTNWTAQTAANFLQAYNRPEPFFLKVSFVRPHSPYDPAPRFWKMYQDADLPPARVGKWAQRYAPRSDGGRAIWHGHLGPAEVGSARQGYYGAVSHVDDQIGRILEALEQRKLLDETLILMTADHGDMTGDHHLWRKSYAYEPSARIPMLMRWPSGLVSARRGQVLDQPVELRDVLATFMEAASIQPRERLDGASLLALVRGQTEGWRKWIDLEHDVCYHVSNHWNALTDGRIKYIYHAPDGAEQLFNLADDPHELKDLAGDPAHEATLREWRQRLVAHFAERGEPFLKGGRLQPRPERLLYSPHFPKAAG
ncbi:MAG: arylsulfatase [Acidobacteria bacterium]|nr:arylsulfatase [Acidobacteriota bacterium]